MKWQKKGLIYCPDGSSSWAKHSALQPTPFVLNDEIIRIYAGFRDDNGVGRVGFVDVDACNPSKIIQISSLPVLDVGIPGTFDENGVIPTYVIKYKDRIYLYYAGYQLGQIVKFYVFAGLAVSDDNGNRFERISAAPILDRTDGELFFRVIHCVMPNEHNWNVWYGSGDSFVTENGRVVPSYNIKHIFSTEIDKFHGKGQVCIDYKSSDEYRVGRPCVIKTQGIYLMFYATQMKGVGYRMGYAQSVDALHWERMDEKIGITVSGSGWDSQMISYPAVINVHNRVYMFYNGNDMGKTGFGYAVLETW